MSAQVPAGRVVIVLNLNCRSQPGQGLGLVEHNSHVPETREHTGCEGKCTRWRFVVTVFTPFRPMLTKVVSLFLLCVSTLRQRVMCLLIQMFLSQVRFLSKSVVKRASSVHKCAVAHEQECVVCLSLSCCQREGSDVHFCPRPCSSTFRRAKLAPTDTEDQNQGVVRALTPPLAVLLPHVCHRQETGLSPLTRTCCRTLALLMRLQANLTPRLGHMYNAGSKIIHP